jgi:GDP-L-fucose synthase
MYNGQHGTNFVGISPCNLFGKYDNFSLENGHVVASLIRKITTASKSPEKKMEVLGTGRPLRQFLYAKDFGRMLLWLLNDVNAQELPHGFVVATSGVNEECSIKQLVETIRNVADPEIEIVYRTDMPDGQYKKTCSNAEFRARCPDFAFTSIEDAIRETTQWYQQHSQEARL